MSFIFLLLALIACDPLSHDGEGKDFEDIQEIVRAKNEEATEKDKNYRFPKNVRKEWL